MTSMTGTTDITEIISLAIRLIEMICILFLIPWAKSRMDVNTMNITRRWVRIAVEAAEMIFDGSGMGDRKKKFVREFLQRNNLAVNDEALNALIESTVMEMNAALDG